MRIKKPIFRVVRVEDEDNLIESKYVSCASQISLATLQDFMKNFCNDIRQQGSLCKVESMHDNETIKTKFHSIEFLGECAEPQLQHCTHCAYIIRDQLNIVLPQY